MSHPVIYAQCSVYVRCPQSSPNPTSRGRIISFPSEANPSLPCAALGPAFSFFCHSLPVPPISPFHIDRRAFSHPGLPLSLDSSTTGSHRSNGAGNPLRWCRSPTQPPKPRTGPHTGFFSFLFIHSPPFPYGERLACFRNRTVPVFQICSQLAHTSPTGPVWCFAGVRFPTLVQKPHTGPHRAEFLFLLQKRVYPSP